MTKITAADGGGYYQLKCNIQKIFTIQNGITERNNTHADNAKNIDVLIPLCNFLEYSDGYSKI